MYEDDPKQQCYEKIYIEKLKEICTIIAQYEELPNVETCKIDYFDEAMARDEALTQIYKILDC